MTADYRLGNDETIPQADELAKGLLSHPGLSGGGQLEIRMELSAHHPDPDISDVASRLKPYHPESWYEEWLRVAEKNEEMALWRSSLLVDGSPPTSFTGAQRTFIAGLFFLCRSRSPA
jgi:hypothetical protein